ncbi:MAG TPA: zinc ribbon domain-containing protein [Candidatus Acidoferrales bacterium]|nr:zinc ribbon domain-containing protein [Candidatus Acidoferrales bacterium]
MTTTFGGHFCGRCGAPLSAGSAFCGRCGAPTGLGAVARALPLPPYANTTHPSKLSHTTVIVAALAAIAVVATLVTVFAVKVSTSAQACGFYCGPDVGARLPDSREFVDTKWSFVVDYSGTVLSINQPDPSSNSADFIAQDQDGNTVGEILITAMPATNTPQAVQKALGDFSSNQFQDITEVEPVPGAEIGLIPAVGNGYTANLVSTSGSSGSPVGIVIVAATHGSTTLLAEMWCETDTGGDAPFYIATDQSFDYVLTNLHFQGS